MLEREMVGYRWSLFGNLILGASGRQTSNQLAM